MANDITHFTQSELAQLDKSFRRELINCLSGFKSFCLMGTANTEGIFNLAPMSSVIHVGARPPLMGVLFRPPVVERHSLENIRSNRFFTLNHVSETMYEAAHQTSARYPSGVSEFEKAGLNPEMRGYLPVPYVAESPVKIGLKAREEHVIMLNQTVLVIGEVMELVLPTESLGEDGFLDLERTGTITVSGLSRYHRTEEISRLPYAKPDQNPSKE